MKQIGRAAINAQAIRHFGRSELDEREAAKLRVVSAALAADNRASTEEFRRYLDIMRREIELPRTQLSDALAGKRVLVTGDTGCIGSTLLGVLGASGVREVVGVSLDVPATTREGVRSVRLDVRDPALLDLVADVSPDVTFHLAAQRDPGLAERMLGFTVTTNVLGTRTVLDACRRAGVPRLVYASTGKALRPYTECVYAESKRVSERLVAAATARGELVASAVRFTHVVDNAILLDRLRRWCAESAVIGLHSLDTMFYAQSAIESAQLLLVAALAPADGDLWVHAIRDLDWPVNLLDLALGAIAEAGTLTGVQEIGHEPGYEEVPYAGLYDPACSGQVSPLFNALEAATVRETPSRHVDAAVCRRTLGGEVAERLRALESAARDDADPARLRAAFGALALADLRATVDEAAPAALARLATLTEPHRHEMTEEHLRIDDAIRDRLAAVEPVDGAA